MADVERSATCLWTGDLVAGSGTLTVGSGALSAQPVTWASRAEKPDGRTSPEELLAAAHATCFAMVLATVLGQRSAKADELLVEATCTLELEGAPRISAMDLHVRGVIPDLDGRSFQDAVATAARLCPVANALRKSVPVNVTAHWRRTRVRA
jgi:lipoyl-dependent peroxiredoxin